MARLGVTYQEVLEVANQIKAQGKNPTIEQVRAVLKTGSSSTIAKHLNQWRMQQENGDILAAKENIPVELVGLMKGLWQRVLGHAQEKLDVIQQEAAVAIEELNKNLTILTAENQEWQKKHANLTQNKEKLERDQLGLEEINNQIKQELASDKAKITGLNEQLAEKQAHISELRRLHEQAQHNLEHYREAAREQRLLDQERFAQQLQQLEVALKQHQQALQQATAEKSSLQQQVEKINYEKTILQQQNETACSKIDELQLHLVQLKQEREESTASAKKWESQYQALHNQFSTQAKEVVEAQKQLAITTQQLSSLQNEFLALKEQNTLLAQERWELAKEKALAEGQIKQLQSILDSKERKKTG